MIISTNLVLQTPGGGALPTLSRAQIERLWGVATYHARIGEYAENPVFLLVVEKIDSFDEFEFKPLRSLLTRIDAELFALAGRACQVAYFIRTHNYCSHCGEALTEVTDELAVYCQRCDYRTYPRISPCIIVAVYRGEGPDAEILLARGERHPPGLFSVLAGFVESGESLEQTVAREVYEESKILVTGIEYVQSQSWPFPHSLMAGFVARYAGGELEVDGVELIEGGWFKFTDLPHTPPAGTIAAALIEHARQCAKG
ncbi:MAG: NAD(+) diphosphatase [Idiomarina sp.]|nr:NAD(+) diphosphatase [Idiomarina sp.]